MANLADIRARLKHQNGSSGVRVLRTLSVKEQTRKKRLERLIQRMDAGGDVARRDLETALTEGEWVAFEEIAKHEKTGKFFEKRPREFDRYIDILKKADFFSTRALTTQTTKRTKYDDLGRNGSARLNAKAESLYEDALIALEELLLGSEAHLAAELRSWLDRDVSFEASSTIYADPLSVPRVMGSKSSRAQAHLDKVNLFELRRDNKKTALKTALDNLCYDYIAVSGSDGAMSARAAKLAALMRINESDEE